MCICYTVAAPCHVWMTSDGGSVGVFWGASLLSVRPWHNGAVCLHFTQHISSACSSHYLHAGTKSVCVCVWERETERTTKEWMFIHKQHSVCTVSGSWRYSTEKQTYMLSFRRSFSFRLISLSWFLLTAHPCYLSVWTWYISHMVCAHCQQ